MEICRSIASHRYKISCYRPLVAIEQRAGAGEVEVKDLVTGKRFTVEVGSLRGRDASAASDPHPNDGECGRPLEDDWSLARERESVIQNLLAGEGEVEPRIEAAAVKLGVSRRQIYTWIGRYRGAPRTSSLLDKRSGRRRGAVQLNGLRSTQTMSYFRSKVTTMRQGWRLRQVNQWTALPGMTATPPAPNKAPGMPFIAVQTVPRMTMTCSSTVCKWGGTSHPGAAFKRNVEGPVSGLPFSRASCRQGTSASAANRA